MWWVFTKKNFNLKMDHSVKYSITYMVKLLGTLEYKQSL